MNKNIIYLWLLCFSAFAQHEKTFQSKPDKAVVYLQGAELTHTENINITAGTTQFVFEGISPQINTQSIQTAGKGNYVITDVFYNLKYETQKVDAPLTKFDPTKYSSQIPAIEDSLTDIEFAKKAFNIKTNALNLERDIFLRNRIINGSTPKDSLPILKQAIEMLRLKLSDIDNELLKNERGLVKLNRLEVALQQRLNTMRLLAGQSPQTGAVIPIHQIIVNVMAETAVVGTLSVSYLVGSAGWTPAYEIRANNTTNDIDLKHHARVWQYTGIDWKDIALTLSTSMPGQNSIKPILSPIILGYPVAVNMNPGVYADFKNNQVLGSATISSMERTVGYGFDGDGLKDEEGKARRGVSVGGKQQKKSEDAGAFTTVNENRLRTEYEIKLKYNLASDNKPHLVVIQNHSLKANYRYEAIPKLDNEAFLIAQINDWENLNLLNGNARIYFDGAYLGETTLNQQSTEDTLNLSLGRDKTIGLTRTKVSDKCKEKVFAENKQLTKMYEIVVRNNKNTAVTILIEDQIPVSKEADIKVEALELSGAKYDAQTGKLTWEITLKPKEVRKIGFGFMMKFPKDKAIVSF